MITGIILARNSESIIARAITCLRKFDEVLVYDTGSLDKTIEVAERFGVRIEKVEFKEGYAKMRNDAAAAANNDHVFHLDTDEVISADVYDELVKTFKENADTAVGFHRYNMYDLKSYVKKWYPDTQWRAYNKKNCRYERNVHETLKKDNQKTMISGKLIYHNLLFDRKRMELNHRFYSQVEGRGCSREEAKNVVDGYLKLERKKLG